MPKATRPQTPDGAKTSAGGGASEEVQKGIVGPYGVKRDGFCIAFTPRQGVPSSDEQEDLRRRLEAVSSHLRYLLDGDDKSLISEIEFLVGVGLSGLQNVPTRPKKALRDLTEYEQRQLARLRNQIGTQALRNVFRLLWKLVLVGLVLGLTLRNSVLPDYSVVSDLRLAQPLIFSLVGCFLGVAVLFSFGARRASWLELALIRARKPIPWSMFAIPAVTLCALVVVGSSGILRVEVGSITLNSLTSDGWALGFGVVFGLTSEALTARFINATRTAVAAAGGQP